MIEVPVAPEPAVRHPLPSTLLHDLRTPLNHILGYSELLLEQAGDAGQSELTPYLEKVRAAGHRLLGLINENFQAFRVADVPTPVEPSPPPAVLKEAILSGLIPEPVEGTILVVDDIADNRDVLAQRLRRQGYAVVTADGGPKALDLLARQEFDLVLLDIMMPDMDGYEVLRRLKADPVLKHMPVVMISAIHELDSVARCLRMGAEDYLGKPFDPALLQARIGASIARKRARDREILLFEELQESHQRLQELETQREALASETMRQLWRPLEVVMADMQRLDRLVDLTDFQREVLGGVVAGGQKLLETMEKGRDGNKGEVGTEGK